MIFDHLESISGQKTEKIKNFNFCSETQVLKLHFHGNPFYAELSQFRPIYRLYQLLGNGLFFLPITQSLLSANRELSQTCKRAARFRMKMKKNGQNPKNPYFLSFFARKCPDCVLFLLKHGLIHQPMGRTSPESLIQLDLRNPEKTHFFQNFKKLKLLKYAQIGPKMGPNDQFYAN